MALDFQTNRPEGAGTGGLSIASWICYYGLTAAPERYTGADLVVFGSRWHPPLIRTQPERPRYLGYVSIGEVDSSGEWWPEVADAPFLVRENTRWGSWVVDVRHPGWQDLFVERIVPEVLAEGFDGLFFDTMDAALSLAAWNDADTFDALRSALLEILARVRRRWPERLLAVNRGLPILDAMAPWIDILVVEGLYSTHDAERDEYRPVDAATQGLLLDHLAKGLHRRPDLPVLTLDYAPRPGHPLAREAVAFARSKGLVPYVSNVQLDRLD